MTATGPGARVNEWLIATFEVPVSVKANWGVQAIEEGAAEIDPFGSASSLPVINLAEPPTWMYPVSIDTEANELTRLLGQVVRAEARYAAEGVTCPMKDNGEFSCLACPLSKADDPSDPKCGLCRAGCEQERLATLLIAQQQPDGV